MVTASHNPKQYTGMKIVRRGALPVGGESGLLDVRDRAVAAAWREAARGQVRDEDIWDRFVDRVLSFVDLDALRPLRIVIDAANGMAGVMLPPVLERLPHARRRALLLRAGRVVPEPRAEPAAAGEPRVHHRPDTQRGRRLRRRLRRRRRPVLLRRRHRASSFPATSRPRSSRRRSSRASPAAKVIYDVRASWAVPETIERAGGVPLINRVGHAFIKQRMREVGAVFAGEVSAHYYFRDFSQADSGTVPFLLMCELVSATRQAERDPRAVPRPVLHHRRDQHAGRRRPGEAPGAGGALRRRGPRLAPRRPLGRLRRLALQRAPVEHRAAAPPEPRGALARSRWRRSATRCSA